MLRASRTWHWRGTTDSVFITSANWITSAGTPDAGDYPGWDASEAGGSNVNGDIIVLDAAVTNAMAGADISAKGEIAGIQVTGLYDQDLGSLASPLIVNMTATGAVRVDASAAGDVYLKGAGARGLVGVTVTATKQSETCFLDGKIVGFYKYGGSVTIQAAAVITGTMMCAKGLTNDGTLTITSGATLPATITSTGGIVECNAAITALMVMGGSWKQSAAASGTITVNGDPTTVVEWTAGTVGKADVINGRFDGSTSGTPRTLTDATVWPGGTLNLNNKLGNIAVTNPVDYQGGVLSPSAGTKLTVA
jgi:hypothetical protein